MTDMRGFIIRSKSYRTIRIVHNVTNHKVLETPFHVTFTRIQQAEQS